MSSVWIVVKLMRQWNNELVYDLWLITLQKKKKTKMEISEVLQMSTLT